jgi:tripartite-type tricarboxylate transporter receptor subunit TctC
MRTEPRPIRVHRRFLLSVAAVGLGAWSIGAVMAAFPERPVTIVVPFAPRRQ